MALPAQLAGYPRLGDAEATLPAEIGGVARTQKQVADRVLYTYEAPEKAWTVRVAVDLLNRRVQAVDVLGAGPVPWQVGDIRLGTTLDRVRELLGPGYPDPPTPEHTQEFIWEQGGQALALVFNLTSQQVIGISLRAL